MHRSLWSRTHSRIALEPAKTEDTTRTSLTGSHSAADGSLDLLGAQRAGASRKEEALATAAA